MAPATHYLLGILILLACVFHLSSSKGRLANTWQTGVLRAFESVFLTTIVMLFTHDRLESNADRADVKLGWPLDYVTQNHTRFDPPYPHDSGWAWEVPTQFNQWALGVNWLFFLACIYCVHWVVGKFLR